MHDSEINIPSIPLSGQIAYATRDQGLITNLAATEKVPANILMHELFDESVS